MTQAEQLKLAIDSNDFERVKALMTANPALHQARMGYGGNGPLTWVAECRVPWGPPTPTRLAMARWMIENGSDIHQGGDGPLMRAALNEVRVPMMELLVAHGADVNAAWNGNFPILFAACEAVNPVSLGWLLSHGADPNCQVTQQRDTALDYLIGSYVRSPRLAPCIDLLLAAGGISRYDLPGVFDTIADRAERLSGHLDLDPALAQRRFPELDCGSTGERRLLLKGATLLHVAAEFGSVAAAKLLLTRGALTNAPALVDSDGFGGQTPIFHSATQFSDAGLPMTKLLLEHGADLSVRAKVPGHYERPDEFCECTAVEYASRFPSSGSEKTVQLLRNHK